MRQTIWQKANQLSIYSANCLNNISPFAQCSSCRDICPQQALHWQDGHWQAANCNLCGLCTLVCPTQVFQIDQPQLLQYEKNQPLQLCCSQNMTAPEQALRINCLQQLTPLTILHLLYQHGKLTLYVSSEDCQQCAHRWYPQGLIQQLEQYAVPADKLQIIIQTDKPEPAVPEENQRREFLRDLLHRTENQSKKAMVRTAESIAATFSSQEMQTAAPAVFPARLPLYALYVKKQLPAQPEQTLPFRQLQCNACNFCGACTHLCPTQALELQEQGSEKQLLYHPELCINCNLCQQVCMQHGFQWGDYMPRQQFLHTPHILAHSAEKICIRCEHSYYQWPADDSQLCSFCK